MTTASAVQSIDSLYPAPPANVPPDLAKASSQYRRHAWLALFGLFTFALLYIALTAWFLWSAYRLFFIDMPVSDSIIPAVKGFGSALLALFMIKGLFFKKSSGQSKDFEITREHEPQLFEFLERIADETKAPRPHKVFLSADVNACVFYDLSILNFLFPSRKNLMIGLGLVNVLSLSEFKAVLAHEFGHFAQNSMAVGRWVYVAQQVATQLIFHRDMLDGFLNGLSRFDLRVAWIGWLLRLVIWSIRSILDTALSLVMLAHHALSREMEFQADLVAVKSTGSDALIHALFRLGPADGAWDEAKGFIGEQLGKEHATQDFFAIQSRILEHKRRILNDPDFGTAPLVPSEGADGHRVFTSDLAQPPQMWSTHPANHLRENNAKERYIPAQLNDQSAWEVFSAPAQLRAALSSHLISDLGKPVRPLEESLQALDRTYDKHRFDPVYRGTYLGRSIVQHARTTQELYQTDPAHNVSTLYPENLTDELEKNRNLQKEKGLLTALRNRVFEPSDGVIRFRGEVIKRRDLGGSLEIVEQDLKNSNAQLVAHDCACRSHHMGLANAVGNGWPELLHGSLAIAHYAEHTRQNLADAEGLLQNTWSVVIADGNVSANELTRVLRDALEVWKILRDIHAQKVDLKVDSTTLGHMTKSTWCDYFEGFRLPAPTNENIGDWLQAIEGWTSESLFALSELYSGALETLLDTEKMLAAQDTNETVIQQAPMPSAPPAKFATLLPEEERTLQTKLNLWDSFQTATGIMPTIARFLVSAAIVVGAILITLPAKKVGL